MNQTQILAHRGASAYAPENTMAAFGLARDMGAEGIELDVQLTRDGKLVVIHDLSIDRTSNGTGLVGGLTLEELRQHDFSYTFGGKYGNDGSRLPELGEVMEFAMHHGLYLNIETKDYSRPYGEVNMRTAELVRRYGYAENTLISSINHNAVALLKRDYPEIRTAIAFMESFYRLEEYAANCRADVLHPYYLGVDEDFMELANRSRFEVNPWTVDDEAEIIRLRNLGVTRIMTNKPDLGRECLKS
ncbi:glycerophosphodiester phosphodiesterase family protein [Paenibacillus sp. S150]|uniref:glycerophosphodiester phosphodiesterase n=1 Tax=Paenibacillus sp. S150 TaxID=2749826 RepID=UPI001C57AE15|nr:glycerophosphodiester phosphodiesterase family protein [Paenibacillus sp. S150]MBW4081324.1 glycerophosphodiester phosphodiesterase [Paenibacillus sp. S150]